MENDVIYSLKDGKFIDDNGKSKGYTPSQISSLIYPSFQTILQK